LFDERIVLLVLCNTENEFVPTTQKLSHSLYRYGNIVLQIQDTVTIVLQSQGMNHACTIKDAQEFHPLYSAEQSKIPE
jgi:hypothetical protein